MIQPESPVVSLEKVEALRNSISDLFLVGDTTLDNPHEGYVRFRGRFLQEPIDCFDTLRQRFEAHGFTPLIREETAHRVALIGLPTVIKPTDSNWIINLILFIATILATLFTGASNEGSLNILEGWPFSLSIMAILTAHEFGHYFAARYHKVPVSLPYFIPLPFLSIIGTLGAFIRLKAPAKNKRVLLDIGVAGPLAGLAVAIPVLLYGLATSDVGPMPTEPYLLEGNSILYLGMKVLVFGQILPGNGLDVSLNQVAWAGWVGLLITSLNLIPVGQLDGGHVTYVLFGKKAKQFYWPVIIALAILAALTQTLTWVIWIGMLYFLGRVHAEPLDDVTSLDPRRRLIAIITFVIFFLTFVPIPIQFISP
ncbi:MAG: site-2 protease family protein [Chloroflexi bacterium]|nr:MAG: site-2 protease family protein [Chloroflexota bacterium]